MKKHSFVKSILIGLTCGVLAQAAFGQTNNLNINQIEALLSAGIVQVGVPATINGETFVVTTNSSGGYTFTVSGPSGALTFTPPTTAGGAAQQVSTWINENNPTNSVYYGTNDLEISLSAVYLQDSGIALIDVSLEKYGLIKPVPQLGGAVELFQGTGASGQQSTAAADAVLDYRKVIGNVAVTAGAGGGYDNWSGKPFQVTRAEVEYRTSKNLSAFVGMRYNLEGFKTSTAHSISGLGIGGGIKYAF